MIHGTNDTKVSPWSFWSQTQIDKHKNEAEQFNSRRRADTSSFTSTPSCRESQGTVNKKKRFVWLIVRMYRGSIIYPHGNLLNIYPPEKWLQRNTSFFSTAKERSAILSDVCQVYPEGNQSNNNQFVAAATGTISAIDGLKVRFGMIGLPGFPTRVPRSSWDANKVSFSRMFTWCSTLVVKDNQS